MRKLKIPVNIIYGTLTALMAVAFFLYTFSFPSEQRGLDPRVYPRFISSVFFALSVGLVGSGIKGMWREKRELEPRADRRMEVGKGEQGPAPLFSPLKEKGREEALSPARTRIGLMFLVAIAYVGVIDWVGYLVATPPFLAGSMVLFGERKWWRILLVSLLTSAVLFGVFRIVFRVPLPVSALW